MTSKYDSAMEFLEYLQEIMPEWTHIDYTADIEYLKKVLRIDNDMRNTQ